ncbi:MAG: TRAP transporter large permease subunit, partial [Treponema sp.]|nr:TRAP transporter large permease subunit [Treponema sp.]
MLRKIENAVLEILIIGLSALPLIFKFFQSKLHIQIPDTDAFLMNLVFMYSCFAGVITWQDERHLSLASFVSKLPESICHTLQAICSGIVAAFVVALFFDSFCQLVNPDQLVTKVLGIPLKLFYFFLPLCYALILVQMIQKKEHVIAIGVGSFCGLLIAMGPITGIFYYVFEMESVPVLSVINDIWLSIAEFAVLPFTIVLVITAFMGIPLFIVIGMVSYVCFSYSGGYVDVLPLETYRILTDKSVAAIPLFTIAGYILSQGSAGKRFVAVFNSLFGWFKGGSVVASVVVLTFFTTFTGVSGVTILALGYLLSKILVGSGYTQDSAESLITASSALGLLFPPSVAIIMYATTNYFSVDVMDLFKGAIFPGILMSLAMIITGVFFDTKTERSSFSLQNLLLSLKDCVWELCLPVLICFCYFSGRFDLFESASLAVIYTFCVTTFIRNDFSVKKAFSVVAESIPVSGGVLFILGAASGLSYYMLDADIPGRFTAFITQYVTNKYLFLILMNVLLLFVGCLMDIYSAILIVSPLLLPIAESFGISTVQVGVIFLMNLSIGFLTPPVGMDLFIASYTFKKPIGKVIRGVLPFLAIQFVVL